MTRPVTPTSQRIGILTAVVALHAALLVAFIANRGQPARATLNSGALSLVSVSADAPESRPRPPPKLPSKLVDEIRRLSDQAIAFEPDSTALTAASGQCATLDLVGEAIVADPSAVDAVVQAPLETRSIAEAIVMWNAGWSHAASTPESPLTPARAIVEMNLAMIEDGCLDEPIAGPRLVPVPVPGSQSTMFLVFGSGTWTWRELLDDPIATEQPDRREQRDKPWYDFDWL